MSERTVIIGAGQAGVQTALSLRQGGYSGEILLAGKETHVPYQRPPLSKQVLKKEWPAERCALRHLEFYEQHEIDLRLGLEGSALDAKRSRVSFSDGSEWEYDHAAICSGSRLNRLNIPGAGLRGVFYLRTLDEALDLAASLQPGVRLAIVGGGYIGLEVAAAARGLGCSVQVIEALDQIMKRSALPEIASVLHRRHESEGVEFFMNSQVASISGETVVEGVKLADGRELPAEVVMVGVGVRPDLGWLDGSGIESSRGVQVDGYCRTSVENVHAAGDVSELRHPLLDGWHVLESVQNAVSQGKLVAADILGETAAYTEAPWFWSEQYDVRLQMAGIPRPGDEHVMRSNSDTGGVSVFSLAGNRLNAVQCIDSPRDYMFGRQLITNKTNVSAGLLADERTNLKELL